MSTCPCVRVRWYVLHACQMQQSGRRGNGKVTCADGKLVDERMWCTAMTLESGAAYSWHG